MPASPASPAPSVGSESPEVPSLSSTRVKNTCHRCDGIGEYQIDDGDGACEVWECRDCHDPSSYCEHCAEAKVLGKAPVCDCEYSKPKKKTMRYTPPTTPRHYLMIDFE